MWWAMILFRSWHDIGRKPVCVRSVTCYATCQYSYNDNDIASDEIEIC